MTLKSKRWVVNPSLPEDQAARFQTLHPVIAQILYNRGYNDPDAARAFLSGQITLGNPFQMLGMNQAVGRIRTAIKKHELIVIYGDFDADGVTSTALMMTVLRKLGANVQPYIPHRVDEGYGLNSDALRKLATRGVKLVITVDCGIRSLDEVEVGKQCGLDMIITDHHSVGPEVPNALAVINPKQVNCKYPEDMLAGVGIAYKLAEALVSSTKANGSREDRAIAEAINVEELLDLVAIGTVADLAPMSRPENRALVIRGLKQLRMANRPGIRAILEVAGITPGDVSAGSIGFAIGPRINAAGRLGSAMAAYELLMADNLDVALGYARQLQELNEKRQQLTREAQEYVKTLDGVDGSAALIFAVDPNFVQGIVGLVAGRLTEEYYRPAIILHRGEHESHGSCRSIAEFNITEALDQCAELLIRHGGHAQAAGFAIYNDNLAVFHKQISEIVALGLRDKDLRPTLRIDAEVKLNKLDRGLYDSLSQLEPCGHDHAAPVLCSTRLKVVERRGVGKDSAHLKLRLTDGSIGGEPMDAIGFRFGELVDKLPAFVDVAYQLDLNEFNGSQRLQLKVLDLREPT